MKYLKIISVSLAFLLALLLSGCGDDIYQEYLDAAEKTSQLESVCGSLEYNVKFETSGFSFSIPIKAEYKALTEGGQITQMLMDMNYSLLGQDIEASAYIDKEYMYVDASGVKTKTPVGTDDLSDYESMISPQLDLPEDILKDAERTVDGNITNVSVTFDGNIIKEQLVDMFTNSLSGIDNTGLENIQDFGSDLNISDVNYKYAINADGYIVSTGIDLSMTTAEDGNEVTVGMNINMTYDNPGQPVEIEIPNLDEYSDMTDMLTYS